MRPPVENKEEFDHAYKMMYSSIISLIKEEIDRLNITQEQLGEMVGLRQSAIARIFKKSYCPLFDTIFRICTALNIDIVAQKSNE